jgi:transposase-like protein
MAQYCARERQQWIAWYLQHGRNVALTCRQFRISRATFYRWHKRYDPSTPQRPLRSHSRRPRTRRRPTWTLEQLATLSDLVCQDPRLGRGRLRLLLLERYGWRWSDATVGRMLQSIHKKCPVCNGRGGQHSEGSHVLRYDLRQRGMDPVAAAEAHRQRHSHTKEQTAEVIAEKAAVVEEANQILRSGRLE